MPIEFKSPNNSPIREKRLSNINGGLNLKYYESLINDVQSPDMQNMNADDRGALTKRKGIKKVYTTSLGSGAINGLYYYNNTYIIAYGTKIYTQTGTAQPVEIYSGISNTRMTFFEFNSILYGINGVDYIQYDGATVQDIVPYIPTTTINRTPGGGGDSNEELNRVGAGFKNSFNGNGADTTYQLDQTGLDVTTVTCTIDGVAVVENTGFTVNRTNGTLDFSAGSSPHGPPASGNNNVIITAYKTVTVDINSIKNCKHVTTYGGENDTRVFLCGNESGYENYVFYSGLLDATYFPYLNYNRLGDPAEVVNGFSKLYDQLIQFKTTEIYSSVYLNESGTVSFPTTLINSTIGCDMPYTIQIINDNPTWCNTLGGVYTMWSNNAIKSEKNVRQISENINGAEQRSGLLDNTYSDLINATSYDFEGKYYLCISNICYVWDYYISPYQGLIDGGESLSWFYYTNFNINCWHHYRGSLYMGDRDNGLLRTFHSLYNDDGVAIDGYWKSRLFAFDNGQIEYADWYKTIYMLWLTSRTTRGSTIDITYINENGTTVDTATVQLTAGDNFDWSNFDWSDFTWAINTYADTIRRRLKIKKIIYFQIKLANNEINENLSIVYLVLQYFLSTKVD